MLPKGTPFPWRNEFIGLLAFISFTWFVWLRKFFNKYERKSRREIVKYSV